MLVLAAFAAGCTSPDISDAIGAQFAASRTVDLRATASGDWQRVCVLGPYSTDVVASRTLGFAWPVETRSVVAGSDAVSLLLFVRGQEVMHAVEHPRRAGDFAALSGRCFARAQAVFVVADTPGAPTAVVPKPLD